MIAVCPKCSARYRVAEDQLGDGEAKLRCSRCQAVFKVRAPMPQALPAQPVAAPVAPQAPAVAPAPAPQPAPAPPFDRARAVLVAHPDVEVAKTLAGRLAGVGLQPLLAHDGVEALLGLQRNLPRAAVLHGELARMSASEVCELVKRNAELREIALVLIDATPARGAGEPFGPDLRLDGVRLESGLVEGLRRLGLTVAMPQPAPVAPAPSVASAPPPAMPQPAPVVAAPPVAAPVAPPVAVPAADDGLAAERAKAERLARIIVSDVILYNEQKFMKAVVAGNVRESMDGDLEEGRTLFRQRIDARVRDERDYVGEELLRIARSRGMQG